MATIRPIERLLIANRGEIAVRIARTAHDLGIATVGVYAEPDRDALHVDTMDLAVALGGASPAESYLRADLIIRAALDTGCRAIHPGYGFLAENAAFARSVIEAGLIWVGPTPEQIALLGDKIAAKDAAIKAGVPTTQALAASPESIPDDVAMPALVKAAAGGGGRGMRVVRQADELGDAVVAASREAASAFGDGTVFIEPYLEDGRHIEVQIMGDAHGNVVHLGERECSIQRRNQKVIEEAPSAGIDADTRRVLCDGAVALARSVGYQSAGTVEFLVGADGRVNFLEVNTRLQVEHPVTEAVTGLDLVELQLRVAAGEPLPVVQDEVVIQGHAVEVRLVAEDPAADWMPSTGRLDAFRIGDHVRVDTGVHDGVEITPDYDSLLAKVIANGSTRAEATGRLARGLRTAVVSGVRTNLACLLAILDESDFVAARTPTSYLARHPETLFGAGPTGDDRLALLLGAVFEADRTARAADAVTGFAPSGWRNLRIRGQRGLWLLDDEPHAIEYVLERDVATVWVGPWPEVAEDGTLAPDERRVATVRLLAGAAGRQVIELDGHRRVIDVSLDGDAAVTSGRAGTLTWRRSPRFQVHEAETAGAGPICPLPGTVIAVHVDAGDRVVDGQLLMVVEAMKMEHKITATGPAVVTDVPYAVGDRVDTGDLLVALAAADAPEDP